MKVLVRTASLAHWLRFCDKIMGSSEYSFGNVFLSYKNGLVLKVTDGCVTAWMKITNCEPFYGEVQVPLKLLKGFLVGEKAEEVEIQVLGDQIVLHGYQETLRIRVSQPKEREHMKPFKEVATMKIREFMIFLDFVTAALEEGDMTQIESFDDSLLLIASSKTIVSLCKIQNSVKGDFAFSIPYMSSRHVVKALKVYQRDGPMTLAVGDAWLSLISEDFAMQICGENSTHQKEIQQIVTTQQKPEQLYSAFGKFVSKAAWLLPKDTPLRITGSGKQIDFYGSYGTVQYKAELQMGVSKPFQVEVSPHRLRSALSRMSAKLFLSVFDEFVRIEDQKGRFVIVRNFRDQ
ncbi:hypothetical protein ACSFC1_07370 [Pseudothermotoga sp. U03pept]|uniref:hypothetical protein n=1 Tax=Pseudothermotoga sp. U03pept TaxID=3447012 RepID=UPI003EFCE20A